MTAPAVVLLGQLVELHHRAPGSRSCQRLRLSDRLLAWCPPWRALLFIRSGTVHHQRAPARAVSPSATRLHRAFHGASPQSTWWAGWDPPVQPVHQVGLCAAVTYQVPEWLRSPAKPDRLYIHWFGDRGEPGGAGLAEPFYADELLPALGIDQQRDYFLIRRPGNTFTVRDWIIA